MSNAPTPQTPHNIEAMAQVTAIVVNGLRTAVLQTVDPATLKKCDDLMAAGGRVGIAVYTGRDGRHHVDLVGAELEGAFVKFGSVS